MTADALAPVQAEYGRWILADKAYVDSVLKSGAERARLPCQPYRQQGIPQGRFDAVGQVIFALSLKNTADVPDDVEHPLFWFLR